MSHDPFSLIGSEVSQYAITEYIGGGGMGVVYKAEDRRLGRNAALKFLPRTVGTDPLARERFLREARSASALDHPNICTIFEVNETPAGEIYIAMAFYEGNTLEGLAREGPLDVDAAIRFAIDTLDGLAAAHGRGIVHRDMKPANVFVTREGMVKILDFGLAKTHESSSVTQDGAVLGTAAYMAPEQALGSDSDHRVDVWAVGAILYELLSGRRPFEGAYPQAVIYGILNADPEPLSGLRPGLPLQLVQSVERALAKDPDRRHATAGDFRDALRAVSDRKAARSQARDLIEETTPDAHVPAPAAPDTDTGVLHLLCVDDEPELELLMQQRFRKRIRAGEWSFTFATDGRDALRKLDGHPEIGVVLTDLNMPGMDGLALLGELAGLDRVIRTVVVSAYGDMEKIRTAMNRGAFDFVTKPVDFVDLDATIQKAARDLEIYRRALRSQQQLVSIRQELDIASRIQDAILPVTFPQVDGLEVYGFSAPAQEVSGTFYDAFPVQGGRLGLIAGDAKSRGVTAALLMAMGQTFVKSFLQQGQEPHACLMQLNRMLFADGLPSVSLQVVAAVADPAAGTLTYANAGHTDPMLRRADGSVEILTPRHAAIWSSGESRLESTVTKLGPGDAVLLPTRGLTDAVNAAGSPFTAERLAATLREAEDVRPTQLIRHVVRAIHDFAGDEEPKEDLTLLAVRRNP
jgi:serine phosphatase RsbU (regulator of sigma subunit)